MEDVDLNRRELIFLIKHPKALKSINFSFSNEGEDQALLKEIGMNTKRGFYIDIGANDPITYSNTLGFYLRGWHGINIDAKPGTKDIFDMLRKRDINLELGVGENKETLTYYSFNESALNTFDREVAQHREKEGFTLISKRNIDVMPLAEILDEYLPKGQIIDFMDIDVEGMDYQVLQSNDWKKYRPHYVLAEEIRYSHKEERVSLISDYMNSVGYSQYMKFVGTSCFIDNEMNR